MMQVGMPYVPGDRYSVMEQSESSWMRPNKLKSLIKTQKNSTLSIKAIIGVFMSTLAAMVVTCSAILFYQNTKLSHRVLIPSKIIDALPVLSAFACGIFLANMLYSSNLINLQNYNAQKKILEKYKSYHIVEGSDIFKVIELGKKEFQTNVLKELNQSQHYSVMWSAMLVSHPICPHINHLPPHPPTISEKTHIRNVYELYWSMMKCLTNSIEIPQILTTKSINLLGKFTFKDAVADFLIAEVSVQNVEKIHPFAKLNKLFWLERHCKTIKNSNEFIAYKTCQEQFMLRA